LLEPPGESAFTRTGIDPASSAGGLSPENALTRPLRQIDPDRTVTGPAACSAVGGSPISSLPSSESALARSTGKPPRQPLIIAF